MKLYSLFIYSEAGICMYYYNFLKNEIPTQRLIEHQQFISGLIQSITNFCDCMNPLATPNTFECFCTDTYKFHYYQTPTNLRFVLLTDNLAPCYTSLLKEYYLNCYVPSISKNPLFTSQIENIKCPLLDKKTEDYFKTKND
ncbi:Sybindin family protein [Entamoeba histolytica HM-1:IMSS-B]|uniref:Trafficking protein particle complex subunit n=8 Tax=Entamoeba TaxID=5758 RepID=C4M8J9_ENTH1|nr:Sybindin family protein [Entamoeba nuttalli P19]XP_650824.1 hypothetical protein, conserved [Entamoeba histolytica HM-1:IMSS]EMD46949.1 trafficking protein particle complex subunit, putative [Entamoeba histolytica KU27]EMH74800.1 Sybindin family protein [Entamoeba histolytica HM-1:IMSS-B]EMS14022.1 trafficking protein particle complex subunit [Entamoeba histolytica HM-3:IMSS]ENY61315.1 trafficking protein particle complex subunit, putative [Entamoeba histolytica HM-1:IMSS-A]GAT97935.1 hypo|eukprot:XP_008859197.1 Sybindin family protein [Entamoeba nuttalli P19]